MESAILNSSSTLNKMRWCGTLKVLCRGRGYGGEVVHLNSLTYRLWRSYIYLCVDIDIYFIYNLCNIDASFLKSSEVYSRLMKISVHHLGDEYEMSFTIYPLRTVYQQETEQREDKPKSKRSNKKGQNSTKQCHLQKYPTLVIATLWLPQQQLNIVMKYYHRVKSTS